ncbi:MAG TPA: spore coat U domain-containing protein [Candidatus Rubrimentiphilum sp.]|nr:spore coat U domain-containing protein [Candidatus Rubrimentiphilum sp.]
MRERAIAALFGALAILIPVLTEASGSATGNLSVNATVNQNCTASSPTLDFGTYNPITTNATASLDSSTTITVNCAIDSNVRLGFDLGTNASGGHCGPSPQRCMVNGSSYLNYNIYASGSDRSADTPWTSPVTETVTGGRATISIYGRVPGGQDAVVGVYTDSVVATVYY